MLFPLYDDNPTRRWPIVTVLLILVNAGIQFAVTQIPQAEQPTFYAEWGFVPARIKQLSDPNLVVTVDVDPRDPEALPPGAARETLDLPADQERIIATAFTTMFLHGGWLHLLLNMWMLWIFGNNIEDRLGHFIFILFYVVSGLLATACHWYLYPDSAVPVVGASGAIAGILGAYAITFPKARVKTIVFLGFIFFPLDVPALVMLGIWFVIEFIQLHQDLVVPKAAGIAFAAHVGGFIAGLLIMPLMAMGAPDPGTHWEDEMDEAFGENIK